MTLQQARMDIREKMNVYAATKKPTASSVPMYSAPMNNPSPSTKETDAEQKTVQRFKDGIVLSEQGAVKPVQEPLVFTTDDVSTWIATSSALGKKAGDYYSTGGWVAPDTKLVDDIDTQLKSAYKVRNYFTSNAEKMENPDATIKQLDEFIKELTTLRDVGKQSNTVFGQYENAAAKEAPPASPEMPSPSQEGDVDMSGVLDMLPPEYREQLMQLPPDQQEALIQRAMGG